MSMSMTTLRLVISLPISKARPPMRRGHLDEGRRLMSTSIFRLRLLLYHESKTQLEGQQWRTEFYILGSFCSSRAS